VDIYHGLQKRYGHAADREDASRQTAERRTHSDSHTIAIAIAIAIADCNSNADSNTNRNAEPYCYGYADSKSNADSHSYGDSKSNADSHSYGDTKSDGDTQACTWRHCFQWSLVRDGENTGDGDLSGFLSDRLRDPEC
jgi:hypothetical protein